MRAWLAAGLALLALPVHAAGQGPSAEKNEPPDEDEEVYRPLTSAPFVALTAFIPLPGSIIAQPFLTFSATRATLDAAGRAVPLVPGDSQVSATLLLFLEAGLHPRLSVGAQSAVVAVRTRASGQEAASVGVADSQLFARGVLLRETTGAVPELTLMGLVNLPTGRAVSRDASLLDSDVRGTGAVDIGAGLNLTKGIRPLLVHLDVILTHSLPARVGGVDVRYGPTLGWSLAAEWPIGRSMFVLLAELTGSHQVAPTLVGDGHVEGSVASVLLGGGLELIASENVQLLLGYQRTVWGRNTAAMDALVVTVVPTVQLF